MVQLIQKNKLAVEGLSGAWNALSKTAPQIAEQQARLSQASMTKTGPNTSQMFIPAKSDINDFNTAMNLANRTIGVQGEMLQSLGTQIQNWGKNTQWAGRQLMVGFTVPFAAVAAAAGAYAFQIDQDLTRIEKVYSGSTDGLKQAATATAASISQTMGQTADSTLKVMYSLASAGKTGAELQQMTTQAQTLATLGNIDQEDSVKSLIAIQNIYKLNTQQVGDAVNYLNSVEAQTPSSLTDLVNGVPIAGNVIKAFGGNLQDTVVLLTAFRAAGIATVEGANAIKTSMARLIEPTKAAQKVFQENTHQDLKQLVAQNAQDPLALFQALGHAIDGINNKMAQQQVISTVFGKQQYSRMNALLSQINETSGPVATAKQISDAGPQQWEATTAAHLKAIQSSTSNQFKVAIQNFKNQLLSFGEFALQAITPLVNGISKLFSLFNSLPAPVRTAMVAFGGILALAGPLTMIVGLFGNFLGTGMKFIGWLMQAKSGFQTMTIEQKAASLMQDEFTKSMVGEVDTSQILIYQLDKLTAAYAGSSKAAEAAALANREAAATSATTAESMAAGRSEQLAFDYSNRPEQMALFDTTAASTSAEKKAVADSTEKQAVAEEKVAASTAKAGVMQGVFNQKSMMAAALVTGIGSAVTTSNTGLSTTLNIMSNVLLGATLLYPALTKVFSVLKASAALEGLSKIFSASAVTGAVSKVASLLKTGLSSVLKFALSPVGLGITIALGTAFTILKSMSDDEKEQANHINAIANSTDAWTAALGKTKLQYGQIKDAAGQVQNSTDYLVSQMRQKNPDVVNEFSSQSGEDLMSSVKDEAFKLQGQGLSSNDVSNALRIALEAAGKSAQEIQQILGNLKVHLDFQGSQQDLDSFVDQVKKELDGAFTGAAAGGTAPNPIQRLFGNVDAANLTDVAGANLNKAAQEIIGRMTSLDPTQRKYVAQQLTGELGNTIQTAFEGLQKQYGQLKGTYQDAVNNFLTFTPGKGYGLSSDYTTETTGGGKAAGEHPGSAAQHIDPKAAQGVQQLAQSEYDLAQKIASAVGITGTQLSQIRGLPQVMGLITTSNVSAADAQKQYNDVLKKAADSGHPFTDAQKTQLAQIYATVDGLDAASLEQDKYISGLQQTQDQLNANHVAALAFVQSLQDTASAFDEANSAQSDFWQGAAAGDGSGFSQLGGQVSDQAKTLTDAIKSTYQNSQNQIMQAFSEQANDYWQNQLDAITNSFEAKKTALQNQMKSLSDSQTLQSQNLSDAQQAQTENLKNSYKAQTDAIDDQIKAIQEQQKVEQNQEQQRQQEFQNEQNRLQRLSQLQNNRVDYMKNIASGSLDEAAKIVNTNNALVAGWSISDAQQADQNAFSANQQKTQDTIDALNVKKENLSAEEQVLEQSLQKQQQMEQRSLQARQKMEQEALQTKIDGIAKEEQAAQKSEQAKQKMAQDTLNIELNSLKTFIPQNEQQLQDSIGRIEAAYGHYGVQLTTSGGQWGQIIGNALQTNVDNARMQIAQDAAWSQFGSQVSNAITQGAFGMSLQDFFNMLETGNAPAGSRMNPAPAPPRVDPHAGMVRGLGGHSMHTGGLVGTDPGGRLGITGPLTSGEIPSILQKGEFVLNKQAVDAHGVNYLRQLNAGDTGNPTGMTGIFGGFAAGMMRNLLAATIIKMGTKPQPTGGAGGSPYTGAVGAGVAQWAGLVDQALQMLGQPMTWEATVLRRMNQESGGNPNAINLWDSNAKAGHPSIGLMQTIGPTFEAYRNPNLVDNIYDPLANIYAGANYAIHRYGSLAGMNRPGGYDNGGPLMPGWTSVFNGSGKPENVLTSQQNNLLVSALGQLTSKLKTGTFGYEAMPDDIHAIAVNTAPLAQTSSVANTAGDQYTVSVTINGSNLSQSELANAIRDGIMQDKKLELKKTGKIK